MRRSVIWSLTLFLFWAASAHGAYRVRVATYDNYEPFCFYQTEADRSRFREVIMPDAASELFTGLAWQVVLKSYQQVGYEVELFIVPWARALKMLEQGQVDAIFPAIRTQQRLVRFRFSEKTVYPPNHLLFYSAPDIPTITDIQTLDRLEIGVIRGFSYGDYWSEIVMDLGLEPLSLNNIEQAVDMLVHGRIKVLPGYQLSHDYYLKKWGYGETFHRSKPFATAYSYLMFRPDAQQARQAFNTGRQQLEDDGSYQSLLEYWQMDVKSE